MPDIVDRLNRRDVLMAGLATGASMLAAKASAEEPSLLNTSPETTAKDEAYWQSIAAQYDVTDEAIMLESGYWGMMSKPVLAAHLQAVEIVNKRSSYYARREFGADWQEAINTVADAMGVSAKEIALTRNATEAMQALITGYNKLKPGDGVLYADLDYPSMQHAMDWLEDRRGAVVRTFDLPEPATHESVLAAYISAMEANPDTKLMLITHVSHRTGFIPPVAEIIAEARTRGIDVIVDAAHSWGQVDFMVPDLGADFIGFNLHKWIGAPLGVGALYIRESRIEDIDPFEGETVNADDPVKARVHTGTMDFAAVNTVPEAIAYQKTIGFPRKAARLRYLRDLWAEPLRDHPGIEILTPDDPTAHGAITSFRLKGKTSTPENIALSKRLLDEFGIFTVHRDGIANGACVRVTPNVFNSPEDVIALLDALMVIAG